MYSAYSTMKKLCAASVLAVALSSCASFQASGLKGESFEGTGWRPIPIAESKTIAREPRAVASLDRLAAAAADKAVAEVGEGKVAPGNVWITIIDARDPRDPRIGAIRGDEPVFPASIIKFPYMVVVYDQLQTGRLVMDPALWDDLNTMIRVSSNEATMRIVDRISNSGDGPSLQGEAWDSFVHKRYTATRYFHDLGLDGIWAGNKTYSNIPKDGREIDFLGRELGPNREGKTFEKSNTMTTNDTARLMYLVWRRAVISPEACREMLDILKRDAEKDTKQIVLPAAPAGTTVYAKGGWVSRMRGEVAAVEIPGDSADQCGAIIIAVFATTDGKSGQKHQDVCLAAAKEIMTQLAPTSGELDGGAPADMHTVVRQSVE